MKSNNVHIPKNLDHKESWSIWILWLFNLLSQGYMPYGNIYLNHPDPGASKRSFALRMDYEEGLEYSQILLANWDDEADILHESDNF